MRNPSWTPGFVLAKVGNIYDVDPADLSTQASKTRSKSQIGSGYSLYREFDTTEGARMKKPFDSFYSVNMSATERP